MLTKTFTLIPAKPGRIALMQVPYPNMGPNQVYLTNNPKKASEGGAAVDREDIPYLILKLQDFYDNTAAYTKNWK